MTFVEKLGLVFIIVFFTTDFPEAWKGLEIFLFVIGLYFFFLEQFFNEWLKDFTKID